MVISTQVKLGRLVFACALAFAAALPTARSDYWEHPDHTPIPVYNPPPDYNPRPVYQPPPTPEQLQQQQEEAAQRERLKTAQIQNEQGVAADENDDWEEALNDFRNATINDPDNPVYRSNLATAKNNAGIFFWDKGDMDTAVAYLEDALRDNPEDTLIRQHLADARQTRKDQQADAEKKRLAKIASDLATAENKEGLVALEKGDWAAAIKDFQNALKNRPTSRSYSKNLAMAQEKQREQQAEEERRRLDNVATDKIHQEIQEYAEGLKNSSAVDVTKVTSGLPRAVEAAITGAFSDAPAGVRERVNKGFESVMTDDWEAAKAWFGDALFHDPNNALLKEWIATCDDAKGVNASDLKAEKELGESQEAAAAMDAAIESLSKHEIEIAQEKDMQERMFEEALKYQNQK